MLSESSNDGNLLAVLTERIEVVGEGRLELLTGDVGKLGLSDKGLGLSTDKLLLENDNLGRVGLLVLELSNLVGDLLLACNVSIYVVQTVLYNLLTYGHGWAGQMTQCCGCSS